MTGFPAYIKTPEKQQQLSFRGESISRYHPCSAGAHTHGPLQPPTRLRPITVPTVRPLSERQLRGELSTKGNLPAYTSRRLSEASHNRLFPFIVFRCYQLGIFYYSTTSLQMSSMTFFQQHRPHLCRQIERAAHNHRAVLSCQLFRFCQCLGAFLAGLAVFAPYRGLFRQLFC